MTKDLSLTVPFSPAIVLGPSIINGDLMAVISSRLMQQVLTLVGSPSSDSSTSDDTSRKLGSGPSGDGREGPH